MPPHCDTMDGPVVKAAKRSLKKENVNLILPWAPKSAEAEIKRAFKKTLKVRKSSKDAAKLADYWFFETVVRLHRAGEGAPYTGLKPAGLDEGPVVPKAERVIEKGNPKEVIQFLTHVIEEKLQELFKHVMAKKKYDENNVDATREYVEAMLGFILYSHKLYIYLKDAKVHGEEEEGGHEH